MTTIQGLLTLLLIEWFLLGIGAVGTLFFCQYIPAEPEQKLSYDHLLHLGGERTPFGDLDIFQTRENVVLHPELDLHAEGGTLLDGEGVVFESGESIGSLQVDDYVWPAFHLEAQGFNDAGAGIVGVADGLAAEDTKGLFPLAEGFVILIWNRDTSQQMVSTMQIMDWKCRC